MSAEVTDWGAARYLSILHGLAPVPNGYWVALCSEEPGTDTDGSLLAALEPADPSYHRVFLPAGPSNWSDPSMGGYLANLVALDFGIPGEDWGLIPYFALCDSQRLGEVYGYAEFNDPGYLSADFVVQIPPGALSIAAASQTPSIVSF